MSPFLFATVLDVVTKEDRKGSFNKIHFADNLVFVSDSIEGIQRKFADWKDSSECKHLKINNQKNKNDC